jgi:hypothetical protein
MFALGAFLGAQYFSASRPNWPAAENARATELPPKAPANALPSCAAESPNTAPVPVESIGPLAGASCCDVNAPLADTQQKDVDLKPDDGASARSAPSRRKRNLRFVSEASGVVGNRVIAPVNIASTIVGKATL